jgi:hypothetical protein
LQFPNMAQLIAAIPIMTVSFKWNS